MPSAIGPAMRPPVADTSWVDWTLVRTTEIAYRGLSAGAKAMIQAWERSGLSATPSSAVPVFAAAWMSPSRSRQQLAVPDSTTPIISSVSSRCGLR